MDENEKHFLIAGSVVIAGAFVWWLLSQQQTASASAPAVAAQPAPTVAASTPASTAYTPETFAAPNPMNSNAGANGGVTAPCACNSGNPVQYYGNPQQLALAVAPLLQIAAPPTVPTPPAVAVASTPGAAATVPFFAYRTGGFGQGGSEIF